METLASILADSGGTPYDIANQGGTSISPYLQNAMLAQMYGPQQLGQSVPAQGTASTAPSTGVIGSTGTTTGQTGTTQLPTSTYTGLGSLGTIPGVSSY
jgi:hypothetical protein